MRYFISPVEMIGTLESATHIVFGINHYNFRSLYDVSKKVREIEKIIGCSSEIIVNDPLELCTIINLKINDSMPDDLVKLINSNVMFQIGDPKELEKYNCCETAYELDEWDNVNYGATIGQYEQYIFINDSNGNEYRTRFFTSQTNFKKWNVDEDELSSLAFDGFMRGLEKLRSKIKLTNNMKEALINRFLVDKTKRDNLRILKTTQRKITNKDQDFFFLDVNSSEGKSNWYNGTLSIYEIFDPIMSNCRPMDLSDENVRYLIEHIGRL